MSEYTTEELLAVCAGLGMGDPLFLRRPPVTDWRTLLRDEVNQIGIRSLVARDLARQNESGGLEIPETIATLCDVMCNAELIVQFVRIERDAVSACCFLITPALAAGQRLTPMGNHRMTLFPTEHAPSAIAEVCAILDRPLAEDASVVVSAGQARAMFDAALHPEPDDSVDSLLRRSGVSQNVTRILSTLVSDSAIAQVVQVMASSADGGAAEGSVTAWIDAGPKGLWITETIPTSDGSPPTVELSPTSKAAVVASIVEGFPAWLDVSSSFSE